MPGRTTSPRASSGRQSGCEHGVGDVPRHPSLEELKEQQSRFAPRRLLEQIDRAEKLLGEIEAEKRYPFEYLFFRITGFRPR